MISFIPTTITIKTVQDEQAIDCEREAMVAQGTGLAYIKHPQVEGDAVAITLTHVPSGTRVGGAWWASSEQEAQQWIELLAEIADWTQFFPTIRPGKHWKVLHLAAIGALHETEEATQEQEEGGNATPVKNPIS